MSSEVFCVCGSAQILFTSSSELVHSEDRFTEIKDALKHICKVDLDKLISSVRDRINRVSSSSVLRLYSWLQMKLGKLVRREQPPHG